MAASHNLALDQGSPFLQSFIIRNSDTSLKDLTGYTARMQFRLSPGAPYVYLDATTENGKLQIDTVLSSCTINLSDTDTSNLVYCQYVYDIEIVNASSIPLRIVQGYVVVTPEITR